MAGCTSAPPPPSSAFPAVVGWSRAEIEQSSDVVSLPSGPPPVFLARRATRPPRRLSPAWRPIGARGFGSAASQWWARRDLARRSTCGAVAAGPAGDTARRDPDRRRDRGRARRGRRGVERRGGGMGERRRWSVVATGHGPGRGSCDRIEDPRRGGHARRLRRMGFASVATSQQPLFWRSPDGRQWRPWPWLRDGPAARDHHRRTGRHRGRRQRSAGTRWRPGAGLDLVRWRELEARPGGRGARRRADAGGGRGAGRVRGGRTVGRRCHGRGLDLIGRRDVASRPDHRADGKPQRIRGPRRDGRPGGRSRAASSRLAGTRTRTAPRWSGDRGTASPGLATRTRRRSSAAAW